MVILVLNSGSSSIKYQVIDMTISTSHLLAKGMIEKIGFGDSSLTHTPTKQKSVVIEQAIADHSAGIDLILRAIVDDSHGVVESYDMIGAVGHRVAHGGERFHQSVVVTAQNKRFIEECTPLAPLHNPANLMGIEAVESLLPNIKQVAVFDTSFHCTIPIENYLYAIPYKYYEQDGIRKYGFHGTSHKYVSTTACESFGVDFNSSKIITCHLGNGASITAIKNGKVVDTSMGFTPVEGLVMGSRCGSIDPSILLYIAEKEQVDWIRLSEMINKESGLLGIGGVSSDVRDNLEAVRHGNQRAELALRIASLKIKRYIGEYTALLGGVDLIVFTGGVGEHSPLIRGIACEDLEYMGVEMDDVLNHSATNGDTMLISERESKVKVAVVPTNEELVIASDTYKLLNINNE